MKTITHFEVREEEEEEEEAAKRALECASSSGVLWKVRMRIVCS
jgi:hypothetical protein